MCHPYIESATTLSDMEAIFLRQGVIAIASCLLLPLASNIGCAERIVFSCGTCLYVVLFNCN